LEVCIGEDCGNGIHQDGVGKITTAPGHRRVGADAGPGALLIEQNPLQPSRLQPPRMDQARGGTCDLLASVVTDPQRSISATPIGNLSLIPSNDFNNQMTATTRKSALR